MATEATSDRIRELEQALDRCRTGYHNLVDLNILPEQYRSHALDEAKGVEAVLNGAGDPEREALLQRLVYLESSNARYEAAFKQLTHLGIVPQGAQAPYVVHEAEGTICPDCNATPLLLAPEAWLPDALPAFYVCGTCGRIGQVGVGEVKTLPA